MFVLELGNHMNEGKTVSGFTLDSLKKLHEAKGFDNKTSVLSFLVQVLKKNDPEVYIFEKTLGQ